MSRNNILALSLAGGGILGAFAYSYSSGRRVRPHLPSDATEARQRHIREQRANSSKENDRNINGSSPISQKRNTEERANDNSSGNVNDTENSKTNEKNNPPQTSTGNKTQETNDETEVDDRPKVHETRGVSQMGPDVPSKKKPGE